MKELLIPVGSMESLSVAIHSGADAVYLGGKKFGARAFANNFTDEEMVEAIKLCHLYGVKIYVTVNTMIYEDEFSSVMEYLEFLHTNGVDAVIVQDIGLISEARRVLPNLEIHASTQVHNTNKDGLRLLEELGVKRVVFARELSLSEIESIDTTMEKEAFIHGALCISYSGECLFSSMLMNRSGNRGACAQVCRLPFKLKREDKIIETDGEYLLSTKELNTMNNIEEIMSSSVISLKIEGRMKSPEYVGCVTRFYRDLIDKYNRGMDVKPDMGLYNDLSVIFNREYTKGFIFNANNKELMNIKTPNHLGSKLGNIIKVDKKYVYIKLLSDLKQGDGIRFNEVNEGMIANFIYNEKEKLINGATSGEVILLDNKFNIKDTGTVNKTLDTIVAEKYRNPEVKRIPIKMEFIAKPNFMKLTISDGVNEVSSSSNEVEIASNMPISYERVEEQLRKVGVSPFKIEKLNITLAQNLFINIKNINELRRNVIDKLEEKRKNVKKDVVINNSVLNKEYVKDTNINITILCRNEEQLKCALNNNIKRVYLTDQRLFKKYQDYENVYLRTKRVNDKTEVSNKLLVTELGALYRNRNTVADYYLNVANHYTIDTLTNYADILTLSVEAEYSNVFDILNHYNGNVNLELVVYSNIEVMITKYCPLNLLVNKDLVCHVCSDNHKYYLVDRFNKDYRLIMEPDIHLTHIMNYKPKNIIDEAGMYKNAGINNFRIELLDEDEKATQELIDMLKNNLL